MRKALFFSGFFLLFVSCSELNKLPIEIPEMPTGNVPLTKTEVVKGLKSALSVATDTSVNRLSAVNGFLGNQALKILLPPESQGLIQKLQQLPVTRDLVEKTITAINRAAEDAAKEAAPIFKKAITNMSIQDAMGILNGVDTAATHYLRNITYQSLWNAFEPKIAKSLKKPLAFNESAESLYGKMINAYNKASLNGALFKQIGGNTLSEHTTGHALQGLFVKVGDEEKKIREDVSHRVNDILQRVFAK